MKQRHNNGGFTLVELMVTIAIGSLITLAGTTTLLLGLRINADSTRTIQQQNTSSMLMEIVENVAEAGAIKDPEGGSEIEGYDGHKYISFEKTEGAETGTIKLNNVDFMEGVQSFEADMDEQLLTVKIVVNKTTYEASIYCRILPPPADEEGGT